MSVIRSLPARMSRQKPAASIDPGKSALTPTIAIGSLGTGGLHAANRPAPTERTGRIREQTRGHWKARGSKLLRAADRIRAIKQVESDFRNRPIFDGFEKRPG